MYFEIVDATSHTLLTFTETEEAAIAFVRELLATRDDSYLHDLAILRTDSSGTKHLVAEGTHLAARALENTVITPAG